MTAGWQRRLSAVVAGVLILAALVTAVVNWPEATLVVLFGGFLAVWAAWIVAEVGVLLYDWVVEG